MARRNIKIPQKDSKGIERSQGEELNDIISSLDSIQGKHRKISPEKSNSVSKTKVIMVLAFISIVTLGLLSLGSYPQIQPNSTEKTISELDFKFQLLDGSEVMLSDYAGDPIILDLMATWCGPCKTQITELRALHSSFPNVQIISVSIDPDYDDITKLAQYKEDNSMTWIVGRDINREGKEAFSADYIPTVAFISSAGTLRQYSQMVVSYDTLVDWINSG